MPHPDNRPRLRDLLAASTTPVAAEKTLLVAWPDGDG